jgi:predicted RNA binding protein YcfA (HicA-like mRNA interferase family)
LELQSAKNNKEERVCLVPEVVETLRPHRPSDFAPGALVFPNGIPRASRLKVDAERNGIQYRDELGRYADSHALHYTWATFLQRNAIPQRFATKLVRNTGKWTESRDSNPAPPPSVTPSDFVLVRNGLPAVRPSEVVAALKRAGFVEKRQKGSHVVLWHERQRIRLTVERRLNCDFA